MYEIGRTNQEQRCFTCYLVDFFTKSVGNEMYLFPILNDLFFKSIFDVFCDIIIGVTYQKYMVYIVHP